MLTFDRAPLTSGGAHSRGDARALGLGGDLCTFNIKYPSKNDTKMKQTKEKKKKKKEEKEEGRQVAWKPRTKTTQC